MFCVQKSSQVYFLKQNRSPRIHGGVVLVRSLREQRATCTLHALFLLNTSLAYRFTYPGVVPHPWSKRDISPRLTFTVILFTVVQVWPRGGYKYVTFKQRAGVSYPIVNGNLHAVYRKTFDVGRLSSAGVASTKGALGENGEVQMALLLWTGDVLRRRAARRS